MRWLRGPEMPSKYGACILPAGLQQRREAGSATWAIVVRHANVMLRAGET